MPQMKSRLRVSRRAAEDLSDADIDKLVDFGRREGELIDEMQAAVLVGDRDLVWQLAEALVRLQDAAQQVATAKE